MRSFIELSRSASEPERPYLAFVFEQGSITSVARHADIAAVADWCKRRGLPVVTIDPQLRAEMRAYGIDAHPPIMRAVGE